MPKVEHLIGEHGKLRIQLEMHDSHGWSVGALWEDLKFDVKHFRDIERLASVGEKECEAGVATFCKPFTSATIRYFDRAQAADASRWPRAD